MSYSASMMNTGVVEATKMWVCRLLNKSKILRTTLEFYQMKGQKSGCAAAHPAHPLPPPLTDVYFIIQIHQ